MLFDMQQRGVCSSEPFFKVQDLQYSRIKEGEGESRRLAATTVRPLSLPILLEVLFKHFIRNQTLLKKSEHARAYLEPTTCSSCMCFLLRHIILVCFQFSFCSRCNEYYKNNTLRRERRTPTERGRG